MSLAVLEQKETPDSMLERVIEMRSGWTKMDYKFRAEKCVNMNVIEFVNEVGLPAPNNPSGQPLNNYRYYLDMVHFSDLKSAAEADPRIDQQITEEMQAMPVGTDIPRWFLEEYQTKECAQCGKRDVKLSLCNGCRSFSYCCPEHQLADWKAKHKFVCLKRKQW